MIFAGGLFFWLIRRSSLANVFPNILDSLKVLSVII